jgi:V/A-type H+-transporting ATPase subunit E
LTSDPALERTIDKILSQTKNEITSTLEGSLVECHKTITSSLPKLEQEYDKILNNAKKEADKLEKQIIGSSDLEARNKQLVLVEDAVEKVFRKAIEQIRNTNRGDTKYSNMLSNMLDEAIKILGTSNIIAFTNSQDKETIQAPLSKIPEAQLSPQTIECLGGVKVQSKDGTMTFDNTIDARLERMKPLIRKEIALKFEIGN